MIHFNVPSFVGKEMEYIQDAISKRKICGDGKFCRMCGEWMEKRFQSPRVMLTTSGSCCIRHAALLCELKPSNMCCSLCRGSL